MDDEPTVVLSPLPVGMWTESDRELADEWVRRAPQRWGRSASSRTEQGRAETQPARTDAAAGDDDQPATSAAGTDGEAGPSRSKKRGTAGGDAGRRPGGRPSEASDGSTPPPSEPKDRLGTVSRGIGQTLITLGVVVLLFVVYELWVTDLMNSRTQRKLGGELQQQWERGDDPLVAAPAAPARPGEKVRRLPLGEGFANIYIPDFGTDYVFTIVEGTSPSALDEGPGHYVDSALPGEVGNFAVAGHRVGKGSPFLNVDKLHTGSAIVIETKSFWYTYRVVGDSDSGDPRLPDVSGLRGMEIVSPLDVGVVAAVPDEVAAEPTRRLLTLTTCHPKFSARQRLVIHAALQGRPLPKSQGLPPALEG